MSNDDYFLQAVFNAAATRTYRAAVSARLTKADREDLHQSIVLDLLERSGQFDPARYTEFFNQPGGCAPYL